MPGPKPPEIVLSDDERVALERLVLAHSTGQALVKRARVVLLAALGYSNMDIVRLVSMDEEAVRLWRRRWVGFRNVPLEAMSVTDRLSDAPRPGAVPRLSAEQVCQIIALACEQPNNSDRPISQWSHRELADEIVRRGITDRISPRHAARLLKSGRPAAAPRALLAHPTDRDAKIADVCAVYRTAGERAQAGQHTVSTDELTYVQALERLAPDLPPRPGKVARHEFEYKRHATLSFMIHFDVATGRALSP